MAQPQPFKGPARRLVIAFDVGTTYSGVSYCILDPGVIPKICCVTRYPGQEHAAGSPKIPTIMYYDSGGQMRSAGAETSLPETVEKAEDEEWLKVEWFKLRLRPKTLPSKLRNAALPPLPAGKTVIHLFADFFAYLMSCAEKFIRETHPTVGRTWQELKKSIVYVIAHPNGWEGAQQSKLRRAAVMGGLVPDTHEGRSRIDFVTEGEASLHYCIRGGFIDDMERGFVVADLGGGTLDFSAYRVSGTAPLRVDEMDANKCELEGSVLVTQRAHVFLKHKLRNSVYGSDGHLEQISQKFDETTKRIFRTKNDTCLIPFGSPMDKDLANGIRTGKLKLTGEEVAAFFEPSVVASVNAIKAHIKDSPLRISAVYLVGGFSASPYLNSELSQRLQGHSVAINSPDGQTVKAVADGAVSFYIDHHVTARVSKVSYGAPCGQPFDPSDPEHVRRRDRQYTRPSGEISISGRFSTILERGTTVTEEKEFRYSYFSELARGEEPSVDVDVTAYRGPGKPPQWVDEVSDPNMLKTLCRVTADVSTIRNIMSEITGAQGAKYRRLDYDIVLYFGGPELKAQICWEENGISKKSAAQIVYEDMSDVEDDDA